MRKRLAIAGLAAAIAAGAVAAAPAETGPPRLLGLRVSNGGTPFAGDTPWLATVSPNGDGFRDRALIRFKLDRAATVEVRVVATDEVRRPVQTIWSTRRRLAAGAAHDRLAARPVDARPHVSRPARRHRRERRPSRLRLRAAAPEPADERARRPRAGIDAGFLARSYPVGGTATVGISTDAKRVRLQLFSFASLPKPTVHDLRTGGVAVAPAVELAWPTRGSTAHYVQISAAGVAQSGLYFLRVNSADGRVGYAPLILRPRTLGEHRVAVVLSTNTWQAYNFLDANGDGWGDSWYVGGASPTVDLRRPFLDFGVPFRFKDWDLSFISWLSRTGKQVDFLTDDDLERIGERRRAAARVRPGRLPGPRGVRQRTRLRRRQPLPRPRRQPDVPLGEQLLLEGDALGPHASTRRDVAHARQARGRARGRAVGGLELRRLAGAVRRAGRDRLAVGVRGHRAAQRLVVRALRDRDRHAGAELAARDAAAGAAPRTRSAHTTPR